MNIPKTNAPAFFDEDRNLWLQIDGGLIPLAKSLISIPNIIMIEHDPPERVFINLTAYIFHHAIKDKPEPKIVIKEED